MVPSVAPVINQQATSHSFPIQSVCQNRVPDIMPQLAMWVVSGIRMYVGARVANFKSTPVATDLVLSSWRDKSMRSYNSSFNKWARWCAKRERNSISGPISDVANFLADLFEEGYQYRSINVYRSSILTTQDKVHRWLFSRSAP